jgi:hypothetical protein
MKIFLSLAHWHDRMNRNRAMNRWYDRHEYAWWMPALQVIGVPLTAMTIAWVVIYAIQIALWLLCSVASYLN